MSKYYLDSIYGLKSCSLSALEMAECGSIAKKKVKSYVSSVTQSCTAYRIKFNLKYDKHWVGDLKRKEKDV